MKLGSGIIIPVCHFSLNIFLFFRKNVLNVGALCWAENYIFFSFPLSSKSWWRQTCNMIHSCPISSSCQKQNKITHSNSLFRGIFTRHETYKKYLKKQRKEKQNKKVSISLSLSLSLSFSLSLSLFYRYHLLSTSSLKWYASLTFKK